MVGCKRAGISWTRIYCPSSRIHTLTNFHMATTFYYQTLFIIYMRIIKKYIYPWFFDREIWGKQVFSYMFYSTALPTEVVLTYRI